MNCWSAATYKTARVVASLQGGPAGQNWIRLQGPEGSFPSAPTLSVHSRCQGHCRFLLCVCWTVRGQCSWESRVDELLREQEMSPWSPIENETSNMSRREVCIPPVVGMSLFFTLFLASFYVAMAGAPQCAAIIFTREGKWIASKAHCVLSSDT